MLSAADFITLKCTPDLVQKGVNYAKQSLAYTYNRMGGSQYARLRRIAGGIALEMGLRRYLDGQGIAYELSGATAFTQPDRYDIAISSRRLDIKGYLLTDRQKIRAVHQNPEVLLEAPALVPTDQVRNPNRRFTDIYVFAFLTTLIAKTRADIRAARAKRQPVYLIYPLPKAWSRPDDWYPFEKIILKAEQDTPLQIEIGGQDAERRFRIQEVTLLPRQRTRLDFPFYSLAYVHPQEMPSARIGIYSPRCGAAHIIPPHKWGNIWLYGLRMFFTGCISTRDFRQHARLLPVGETVFQYRRTRIPNYALPVARLHPLTSIIS